MKTHIELGISKSEYDALIATAAYLRADEDLWIDEMEVDDGIEEERERPFFNMLHTCEGYACGTVACIGGHVSIFQELGRIPEYVEADVRDRADKYVSKKNFQDYMDSGEVARERYEAASGLAKLFYPAPISNWNGLTPVVAADAIDRFLATGDPGWVEIAKEKGFVLAPGWNR